jgi:alkaline phosphatase
VTCDEVTCPDAVYGGTSHTTRDVPVYAIGYNAESVSRIEHQSELFEIMKGN